MNNATIIILILVFLCVVFVLRKGKGAKPIPSSLQQPRGDRFHFVWAQGLQRKVLGPAFAQQATGGADASAERCGMEGEQAVMRELATLDDVAVYWNVGVNLSNGRCEIDHLVVTPEGVIIVETKNLHGVWESADGSQVNPEKWERVGRNEKIIRSPFVQIERTSKIFKALLRIIQVELPVGRLIVFSGNAQMNGFTDNRAVSCSLDQMVAYIEHSRREMREDGKIASPIMVLQVMAFFAKEGCYPAFYDRRLWLSLLEGDKALDVDSRKILEAIFSQIPGESPVSLSHSPEFRPKTVLDAAFNGSFLGILSAFKSSRITEELNRDPSGMVCDPEAFRPTN